MNTPAKRPFAVSIQRGGFFRVHIHSFAWMAENAPRNCKENRGVFLTKPDKKRFDTKDGAWWCEVHCREATHVNGLGDRCCDPRLGGIMMPCRAVFVPVEYVDGKRFIVNPEWINASHVYRDGGFDLRETP